MEYLTKNTLVLNIIGILFHYAWILHFLYPVVHSCWRQAYFFCYLFHCELCVLFQYIQNFIIKTWSLVKIGTTQAQKKLFYKIVKVRKALESSQEDEKKYEVLANDLDVTKEDIIEMEQRMAARDLSLDTPFDEDHELTHLDFLQEGSPNQEEALAPSMNHLQSSQWY